jgi:hypothetical protein
MLGFANKTDSLSAYTRLGSTVQLTLGIFWVVEPSTRTMAAGTQKENTSFPQLRGYSVY